MFRGPRTNFAYSVLAIALGSCQANSEGLKNVNVEPGALGGKGGAGGSRKGGSGGSAVAGNGGNTGGSVTIDAGPTHPIDAAGGASGDAAPLEAGKPIDTRPAELWKPAIGMSWDYQLTAPINPAVDVQVFEIGLFDTLPAVVADLHARGRKVICHVDFGTYEAWHPDAEKVPKDTIGGAYRMDPDRRWLDIRNQSLMIVMRGRLDMAVRLGCDAVAPDNMDAWDIKEHEPSGFPLMSIDQLIYNRTIAKEAHNRGLAIGLKDDVHQIEDLVDEFDFHVSEECFARMDCDLLKPFIDAKKPVFEVEYMQELAMFCPMAKTLKFSAIKKKYELDAYREACPP
jgi:hypothetical protein